MQSASALCLVHTADTDMTDPSDQGVITVNYQRLPENIIDRLFPVPFLPEHDYVTFGSLLSPIRLSSVCNVGALYSGG